MCERVYTMGKYIICGGKRISGETEVQGSKNSALPILAACLLADGVNVIHNCPGLSDIDATIRILEYLGCRVTRQENTLIIDSTSANAYSVPDIYMREMRSSVIFLGSIIARMGKAHLSTPGGCEIGLRPIDIHVDVMRKLGVEVDDSRGSLECVCNGRMKGAKIILSFPSVGATENAMIAASTAQGVTEIVNAAREPEISDFADFLNCCGARITGAGEGVITIEGVEKLRAAEYTVIPDRIAAGTLMASAAITHGSIRLTNIIPAHLGPVIALFEEAGCDVGVSGKTLYLNARSRLKRLRNVRTMPYPGFPTDMQAPVMAMCSVADGTSVIIETIFESRFKHVSELSRFGAKISVDGRTAVIEGVPSLVGAPVMSPDLRGGAALVIAALAARGESEVGDIRHIDRGYDKLENVLSHLGADIKRVEENDENELQKESYSGYERIKNGTDEDNGTDS